MLLALDPNWLMSTAAQSAAAIVAIVGGFLVSRLIAANSERAALVRRLRDGKRRLTDGARAVEKMRRTLLDHDAADLVASNLQYVLGNDGKVTAENLLTRTPRDEWTADQFNKAVTPLLQMYEDAFKSLSTAPSGLLDRNWADVKVGLGLTKFKPRQDDVLSIVYEELSYRKRRKERKSSNDLVGALDMPLHFRDPNEVGARSRLSERVTLAEGTMSAASLDVKSAEDALEELPKSKDLWGGFVILCAFSVSGVVLPLILIATQGGNVLSSGRKVLVMAGFLVGLCSLGIYLARQILHLDIRD